MILSIIFGAVGFCFGFFALLKLKEKKEIDAATQRENDQLKQEKADIINSIEKLLIEKSSLEKNIREKKEQLTDSENIIDNAFQSYVLLLENNYAKAEEEYDNLKEKLIHAYDQLQADLAIENEKTNQEFSNEYAKKLKDIQEVENQIKKLQDLRNATIQANLREEEMKNKLSFYSLTVDAVDLADIEILDSIKPKLAKPRVLSMLIWSTFFQKPMTTLCNNVVGAKVKTGIYKITNQKNNMCYIGQAVDISTRWKEHAKCGLEIDTPINNKLYQAMIRDGIWNFTWEVLEECDKALLNEKERSYIEIYQSNIYGYNSTIGNKK